MKPLKPTDTLDRHIHQEEITTGPRKLELFKRALTLRGAPPLRTQEDTNDPTVFVKLFDPCGRWVWYLLEWSSSSLEAFGFVTGDFDEFGYVDLVELSEVAGPLGIGIEIDVWFLPQPLSEALRNR